MGSRPVRRGVADEDDPTSFAPRRKDGGKSRRMEAALERLAEVARERRRKGGRDDYGQDDEELLVVPSVTDEVRNIDADDASANVVSMAATERAATGKDASKSGKQGKNASDKRATKTKSTKTTGSRKRKAANAPDDEHDENGHEAGFAVDDAQDSDAPPARKATRKKRTPKAKKTRVESD